MKRPASDIDVIENGTKSTKKSNNTESNNEDLLSPEKRLSQMIRNKKKLVMVGFTTLFVFD